MHRTAYAFVVLAAGLFLLLAPVAPASADTPVQHGSVLVRTEEQPAPSPTPESPSPAPHQQLPPEQLQRYTVGAVGAALIGLVLLSRKLRKKPLSGFQWKKKG